MYIFAVEHDEGDTGGTQIWLGRGPGVQLKPKTATNVLRVILAEKRFQFLGIC